MTVSKSEITTFLKGIYPFRSLPFPELEDLVEHIERKNLTKNETFFEIGQKADKLVIPFTCQIRLERLNQNNQYETFSILDPGEFLGLESIYQDQIYETRAICHSTGTALILHRNQINSLLENYVEADTFLHMLGKSYYPLLSMRMSWRQEDEAVFWSSRKHPFFLWIKCAIPTIISITLLTIYLVLLMADLADTIPLSAIFGTLFFFVLLPIIYFYIDWADDYFIITDRRVISRNRIILLYDTKQETHIDSILSVNKKIKSLLAARIDYGDIVIHTFTGTLLFEKVPNPNMVYELLEDTRSRYRSSRSKVSRQEKIEEMKKRLGYVKQEQSAKPPLNNSPDIEESEFPEGNFVTSINQFFQILFQLRTINGEQITYRTHWFMFFKQARFVILLSILPLIYFFILLINLIMERSFNPPLIVNGLMVLLFLITYAMTLYKYVDWRNDRYILDNQQIIDLDKKPFGREDRRTASLSAIQSVEYKRIGFSGFALNFGTVYIRVGDIQFTFDNVANPSSVQQEISERIQAAKERERQEEIQRERDTVLDWIEIYHSVAHKNPLQDSSTTPSDNDIGQA